MPKCVRVLSYVTFTQQSGNLFLMIVHVDPRQEILLQSEVPPLRKVSISGTESVHGYQVLSGPVPILNMKHRNTIHTTRKCSH